MPDTLEIQPSEQQHTTATQDYLASKPAAGEGEQRTSDAPQKDKDELEKKIQNALRELVTRYERESDAVRRHHVKRFLEAEEFWKGNQHLIWSEGQFRWQTPFEWAIEQNRGTDSQPRYQYVTNIYRAYGLSIIAAISQRLPKVRFQPKSAKSETDLATAKAASDVAELVEANNELDTLAVRCAYLLWTQGLFAAYVRYVVDKGFGTKEVPKVENQPVEISPDRYFCPQCASETPADQVEQPGAGLVPTEQESLACPDCGYQLSPADFRGAETGIGPVVTGTMDYPDGQEVISIYGGLNLKLMPTAEKLKDSAYLILCEEKHSAALRAAYPNSAARIGFEGGGSAEDTYEKFGRLALTDSAQNTKNSQPFAKQVTFKQAWLRDWALWGEDDPELRAELVKRYPEGVYVALAGSEFLEARAESMDEHWEICRPMPGIGMYTDAAGSDTIPIQKRLNDATNIVAEHIEFGSAPPVWVDGRYVDVEALKNRRAQPASFYPIGISKAPGAVKLADLMHQPQLKIDQNIYQHGKDLIELAQVTSGAMPSIFGGELQGNETASGYAMARAQSLGKLNLFWRAVKQFFARVSLLGVECFRKNRTDDYESVVFDRAGKDFKSKFIHLENLKGNITAHPEADEDFPASWAEIRENLLGLMKSAPDEIKALLMLPANAPTFRKFLANPEIVLPLEDDREKQYREIEELLGQRAAPELDPVTGAPTGEMTPSLMPEPFVDNHDAHIATVQEWSVADSGIEAKKMNPGGYGNVQAHLLSHIKAKAYEQAYIAKIQAEQQMAMLPPGVVPPGPGDGTAPPPPADKGAKPGDAKPGDEKPAGKSGEAESRVIPGAQKPIQELANQPA